MMHMTLDQSKKRFVAWRKQRPHREPIPEGLWQIACSHIPSAGITRVARELRLNITKLREKAIQSGILMAKESQREIAEAPDMAFQEISLDRVFMPSASGIHLVLERPDGMRIRIEGQLPDPEYVNKLAVSFLR